MAITAGSSASNSASSAASVALSGLSVVADDIIVVGTSTWDNSGTPNAPTDDGTSITWTEIGTQVSQSRLDMRLWWGKATTTETVTITLNASASVSALAGGAQIYKGVDTTTPIQANVATATGATNAPTVNVTPVASTDWFVGQCGNGNARTFTVGTDFTLAYSSTLGGAGGSSVRESQEYWAAPDTDTEAVDGSLDAAGNWAIKGFTLKEAAGGGGGRIMSSLAAAGGLAGSGGIAGAGGGLAG